MRRPSSGTLSAAHITVSHGTRPVLDDVSLALGPRARPRAVDQPRLVQRHVAEAAPDVAVQGPQERRQQRRAQERLVVGERVGQPEREAAYDRFVWRNLKRN